MIEITFDQPFHLVKEALASPRLAELFDHWKVMPTYSCLIRVSLSDDDKENECVVSVQHEDVMDCHEATDLVEAFLYGYFAAKQ